MTTALDDAIRVLTTAGYSVIAPVKAYDRDTFWDFYDRITRQSHAYTAEYDSDHYLLSEAQRSELLAIFDWQCNSCRPDVGWPKNVDLYRCRNTGALTTEFQCGHCGTTNILRPSGDLQSAF